MVQVLMETHRGSNGSQTTWNFPSAGPPQIDRGSHTYSWKTFGTLPASVLVFAPKLSVERVEWAATCRLGRDLFSLTPHLHLHLDHFRWHQPQRARHVPQNSGRAKCNRLRDFLKGGMNKEREITAWLRSKNSWKLSP